MTREILLLVDYRGFFYSSVRVKDSSMDLDRLVLGFDARGYALRVLRPFELDLRTLNCRGVPVLYQSAEDRNALYKGYLEDILLGLALRGADLVPRFRYFRAHHNKVFMEILRALSPVEEARSIFSRSYGTFEEFLLDLPHFEFPVVMKRSDEAGGRSVRLCRSPEEARRAAGRMMRSPHFVDYVKDRAKRYLRPPHVAWSFHRRKLVVQNFLPGLTHDYKVIVFGERHFVLRRENRPNDFRASGSGLFSFQEDVPRPVLDLSRRFFAACDCPYVSMDIAYAEGRAHLIEFQFVTFGTLTVEKSPFHFVFDANRWRIVRGPADLEECFCDAVVLYLESARRPVDPASGI